MYKNTTSISAMLLWLTCVIVMVAVDDVVAESFPWVPGQTMIGKMSRVEARHEDTLLDIARRHGLGVEEIVSANPEVNRWLPGKGTPVFLPTQFILPSVPHRGIILNIPEMRMYYFPPKKPETVVSYPLGVGKEGWRTPYIRTKIISKRAFPDWYPPESIRKEHAAAGDPLPRVVKAGPDNPLGDYAMRLGQPEYLIHGTNKPWGVGMRVSHGCIRLYPEDIEELFQHVSVNTAVNIINQPYKVGLDDDLVFLEAHTWLNEDVKEYKGNVESVFKKLQELLSGVEYHIDWELVEQVIEQRAGYPVIVGFVAP